MLYPITMGWRVHPVKADLSTRVDAVLEGGYEGIEKSKCYGEGMHDGFQLVSYEDIVLSVFDYR